MAVFFDFQNGAVRHRAFFKLIYRLGWKGQLCVILRNFVLIGQNIGEILQFIDFWATVCGTVRHMLSDSCPVCLSVLSVTLVYCGQTVRWIKMKLGTQIGLGTGHIALDGDPAPPPKKVAHPQFLAHVRCGQTAGMTKMLLGMEVGLGPGDFVFDGDSAPLSPKRGRSSLPNFRPMSIVAEQLDESRWHLAWRWALDQAKLC